MHESALRNGGHSGESLPKINNGQVEMEPDQGRARAPRRARPTRFEVFCAKTVQSRTGCLPRLFLPKGFILCVLIKVRASAGPAPHTPPLPPTLMRGWSHDHGASCVSWSHAAAHKHWVVARTYARLVHARIHDRPRQRPAPQLARPIRAQHAGCAFWENEAREAACVCVREWE
jgi:hypothetical protein